MGWMHGAGVWNSIIDKRTIPGDFVDLTADLDSTTDAKINEED
jgi:hypothetical protein